MDKKHIFSILLLSVAIFVAGCAQEVEETTRARELAAFVGGPVGIVMEFLPGAPPEEVFDTDFQFSVDLKIENVGEFDVAMENATIKITGIDPSDFGLTGANLSRNPDEDLDGAQKDPQGDVIRGTVSNVEFPPMQYAGEVSGFVQFNIKAENCYEYGTKTQALLCVREDLLGKRGQEGACDPNEEKPVDNSGAPVHITTMTEAVTGSNKISFVFNIEHVGTGHVFKRATGCSTEFADQDKVFVTVTDPGIGPLSCSGLEGGTTSGFTTLFNDQRSIRCSIAIDEASLRDFEKVLNVELRYGYRDSIEVPLIVKHGG